MALRDQLKKTEISGNLAAVLRISGSVYGRLYENSEEADGRTDQALVRMRDWASLF